ncbi:MAG: D-alanine--D-alanine ligase [Pleurocapsa minor GSE-CHR-MK-17-07R]|jgi:D-alanine-D-alanine ligase|nr:D-alanine--D-alanine ligase [Pleurocapsa minor GSE-CHR-MK 17-07R]
MMNASRQITLGVIFGGRSVEHDVSVVTGHQVMEACDPARYRVVPLYIDREGRWFTGEPLRDLKSFQGDVAKLEGVHSVVFSPDIRQHGLIVNPLPTGLFAKSQGLKLDAVFPAIHGSHGEDGTLQGLFELADIPYAGCGVLASALANDKWVSKQTLRQAGVPVVDGISFTRAAWDRDPDALVKSITHKFAFPIFVKPVTLGSSIGIGRATDEAMLRAFIGVAASLDRRVLIEPAVTNCVEINCAVLGDDERLEASVLEQPVSWEQFLTYEEKYLRGGEGMKSADRLIPAPLTPELTKRIQDIALQAFRALDGRGTARIDFLVRPETNEVFLNEVNTMPGSIAFYLWRDTGMSAGDVIQRMLEIASNAQAEKRRSTYNYQTNLIALTVSRGAKGSKGGTKRP